MGLNLIDLSNRSSICYYGNFNNVTTYDDQGLLPTENSMNNNQLIEDLKQMLLTRFDNNVESLAKAIGVPTEQVIQYLEGQLTVPNDVTEKITRFTRRHSGEYIQIGDRIEIHNAGDGATHNYAGLLGKAGPLKKLKDKIVRLKKEMKEKDELIAALKEANELLKKDSRKG